MYKFIFDLLTDPFGLPIDILWEYIILAIIGVISLSIAYRIVGYMYHDNMIGGKFLGSIFHWIIRLIVFVILWAVTYSVISVIKWLIEYWIIVFSLICIVIIIVLMIIILKYKQNFEKSNNDEMER